MELLQFPACFPRSKDSIPSAGCRLRNCTSRYQQTCEDWFVGHYLLSTIGDTYLCTHRASTSLTFFSSSIGDTGLVIRWTPSASDTFCRMFSGA